jgi:WD repeat-containing protein 35
MQVKVVMMDDVLADPEGTPRNAIMNVEVKRLADIKGSITESGVAEAAKMVEETPHPRLWKLVGESSLGVLDLETARKAFIRSADYSGLQFVKRLHKIEDRAKCQAEVASYFSNYDMAEKLYLEMDRKDLAVDLRVRLGDWVRVIQLIKSGGVTGSADDVILDKIRRNIGDYYYDRQRWYIACITFNYPGLKP